MDDIVIGRPMSTIPPPNVCTLVGPTRHYKSFDRLGYLLGRRGWLVFSIGSHRTDDAGLKTTAGDRDIYWHTHRQKIRVSSLVYVVDMPSVLVPNAAPYIGGDTRAEIDYAHAIHVPVAYMSAVWGNLDKLPYAPGLQERPHAGRQLSGQMGPTTGAID